ncbi:MAG: hypothetical protein RLZZ584_1109 [Pseudomonadota bacterium]
MGELEVQLAADGEHHVGLAHHRAAHGGHDPGVVVRQPATAFTGVEIERAQGVEQGAQLRAGALGAAAGDGERAPGRPQQLDGSLHRGRVGQGQSARRRGPQDPPGTPSPGQNRWPMLNSVSTPSSAKMAAAMACTSFIDSLRAMASPRKTAGTLASIMPSVVPATTATRSV